MLADWTFWVRFSWGKMGILQRTQGHGMELPAAWLPHRSAIHMYITITKSICLDCLAENGPGHSKPEHRGCYIPMGQSLQLLLTVTCERLSKHHSTGKPHFMSSYESALGMTSWQKPLAACGVCWSYVFVDMRVCRPRHAICWLQTWPPFKFCTGLWSLVRKWVSWATCSSCTTRRSLLGIQFQHIYIHTYCNQPCILLQLCPVVSWLDAFAIPVIFKCCYLAPYPYPCIQADPYGLTASMIGTEPFTGLAFEGQGYDVFFTNSECNMIQKQQKTSLLVCGLCQETLRAHWFWCCPLPVCSLSLASHLAQPLRVPFLSIWLPVTFAEIEDGCMCFDRLDCQTPSSPFYQYTSK